MDGIGTNLLEKREPRDRLTDGKLGLDLKFIMTSYGVAEKVSDIISRLVKESLEGLEEEKATHASEVLGKQRKERILELNQISQVLGNFEPQRLGDPNYCKIAKNNIVPLRFQHEFQPDYIDVRPLTSTCEKEIGGIVDKLRDFNTWSKLLIEDRQMSFDPNRDGFFFIEMAIEWAIEKFLKEELTSQQLEQLQRFIPDLGVYLYQRLIDPNLSKKEAYNNYLQDYYLWAILGNHNNEIALKLKEESTPNNFSDRDEEDVIDDETPFNPSETVAKDSRSAEKKLKRENRSQDVHDYIRSTQMINGLFDSINLTKILETASNDPSCGGDFENQLLLAERLLKQERISILAIYLQQKFSELETLGFEIDDQSCSVKSTLTGYSDLTLKFKKKYKNDDNKDDYRYYEIQFQTETTLNNKKQETPENNLRKDLLDGIYDKHAAFISDFNHDDVDKNKILIQKLVLIDADSPTEFNALAKAKIKKELEDQVFESLDNTQLDAFITSIFNTRPSFRASIARSRQIFGVGSFLSTKADCNSLVSQLGEYGTKLSGEKIAENKTEIKNVEENTKPDGNPVLRLITACMVDGELHFVLGEKSGILGKGNLSAFGGSSNELIEMRRFNYFSVYSPEAQYQIGQAIFEEVLNEEILKIFNTESGKLDYVYFNLPDSSGYNISYSVVNPAKEGGKLKEVFPRLLLLNLDKLDNLSLNLSGKENYNEDPIFLTPEQMFNCWIRCAYDGKPFNANLAQMPLRAVLQMFLITKRLQSNTVNRIGSDTNSQGFQPNTIKFETMEIPKTSEQQEKIRTARTIVVRNGQKGTELLYLENGPIKENKLYNYLPATFEGYLNLSENEQMQLVGRGMASYFRPEIGSNLEQFKDDFILKEKRYNNLYNQANGKLLKSREERMKQYFSPKPEGSFGFPGGKLERGEDPQQAGFKELTEELGLYHSLNHLLIEYYNEQSPDIKMQIANQITKVQLIISKLKEFYRNYPDKNLVINETKNSIGKIAQTNYFILDLDAVLGSDLAKDLDQFILLNRTLLPDGTNDDGETNYGWETVSKWQILQNLRDQNYPGYGRHIVDHSRLAPDIMNLLMAKIINTPSQN